MAAFTTNVIGVVNDETVDGVQKVDERGTTNNTHIINHGQQEVGNDSNLLIVFYVQIMPDDFVMQLHRF
ncbi:hypothetical protein LL13C14_31740 [Escherichia coli]